MAQAFLSAPAAVHSALRRELKDDAHKRRREKDQSRYRRVWCRNVSRSGVWRTGKLKEREGWAADCKKDIQEQRNPSDAADCRESDRLIVHVPGSTPGPGIRSCQLESGAERSAGAAKSTAV